jgi:hypothetical protein
MRTGSSAKPVWEHPRLVQAWLDRYRAALEADRKGSA